MEDLDLLPGDAVEVECFDLRGGDGAWIDEDDKSLNAGPCVVEVRGTLVKKESDFITIALCKTISDLDGTQYMGFITVPTAVVTRINKLQVCRRQ